MKLSTKIAKEATITFVGMGFGNVIRYIYIALLARLVGAEYLGIYTLANAITRLTEVFGKAGLDGGILRFVSMRSIPKDNTLIQHDICSALKMGLIISLIFMIVQISLAHWLTTTIFREDLFLKTVIIFYALSIPFSVIMLIAANATQGFKLLKYKVFVSNILNPLLLLLSMVVAFYLISTRMAVIIPPLVTAFLGCIVIMIFLKNLTGINFKNFVSKKFNVQLFSFSFPLMFIAVIGTIMHWVDVIMLGYFLDIESVGLYQPAARTTGLLRVILISLIGIFGPVLSELHSKKKHAEMNHLYKLVFRWISTLVFPLTIILFLFPEKVMLVFGGEYVQAKSVLVILSVAVLIQSLFGAGNSTLMMTGHPRINLLNTLIATIIDIVLNILWIPRYGLIGAASATCVSLIILSVLMTIEVWYVLRLQPISLKALKPFIASGITFVMLYHVKSFIMSFHTLITLTLAMLITFIIYGFLLWIFRFDADDREVWSGLLMIIKSSKRV